VSDVPKELHDTIRSFTHELAVVEELHDSRVAPDSMKNADLVLEAQDVLAAPGSSTCEHFQGPHFLRLRVDDAIELPHAAAAHRCVHSVATRENRIFGKLRRIVVERRVVGRQPRRNRKLQFAETGHREVTRVPRKLVSPRLCPVNGDAMLEGMAKPPKRIAHYELGKEIGRGGMGVVYQARSVHHGGLFRGCVVKLIRADEISEQILREARVGMSLSGHANIVATNDVGEEKGFIYIAMDHVSGLGLDRFLWSLDVLPAVSDQQSARVAQAHALTLDMVLYVILEAADGLGYAHEMTHRGKGMGIVHRDIKPSNIMVSVAGEVKILDFGIAKIRQSPISTSIPGTLLYMAPEHARGEPVTPASDFYSLGLVLFEMLAGSHPRRGWGQGQAMVAAVSALREVPTLPENLNVWVPEGKSAKGERLYRRLRRSELPTVVVDAIAGLLSPDPARRLMKYIDLITLLSELVDVKMQRWQAAEAIRYIADIVPSTRTTLCDGDDPDEDSDDTAGRDDVPVLRGRSTKSFGGGAGWWPLARSASRSRDAMAVAHGGPPVGRTERAQLPMHMASPATLRPEPEMPKMAPLWLDVSGALVEAVVGPPPSTLPMRRVRRRFSSLGLAVAGLGCVVATVLLASLMTTERLLGAGEASLTSEPSVPEVEEPQQKPHASALSDQPHDARAGVEVESPVAPSLEVPGVPPEPRPPLQTDEQSPEETLQTDEQFPEETNVQVDSPTPRRESRGPNRAFCRARRRQAEAASSSRSWSDVLTYTRAQECWAEDKVERRRLIVRALLELGRFEECEKVAARWRADGYIAKFHGICQKERRAAAAVASVSGSGSPAEDNAR